MKQIPDFSDYFIDENGDVFSKSYHPIQNKNCELKKLKISKHKSGYLYVVLFKNGKRYFKKLHKIIAETFIPNHENHPFVRHLDDNKLNNSLENLAWGTHQDNMDDRKKNGNNVKGERNGRVKLTEEQVIQIRQKYISRKYTQKQLAKEYGVSQFAICNITNYKRWKHI